MKDTEEFFETDWMTPQDALSKAIALYIVASGESEPLLGQLSQWINILSAECSEDEIEDAKAKALDACFPKRIKPKRHLRVIK